MLLKQPLNPLEYEQSSHLFDHAYTLFQVELNFRDNRPTLFGKRIFIDATSQIDDKINSFWHLASIGAEDSKFDMFPCLNDDAMGKCIFSCNVGHSENFLKHINSTPCIYRACRISWVREIIEISGSQEKSHNLTLWIHEGKGQKNLLLRYQYRMIDYIIIFKISLKDKEIDCFRLVTAFPVVLRSYKKRYDREYNEFNALKRKPAFLRI